MRCCSLVFITHKFRGPPPTPQHTHTLTNFENEAIGCLLIACHQISPVQEEGCFGVHHATVMVKMDPPKLVPPGTNFLINKDPPELIFLQNMDSL